ncbi:unnamed protein product [Prorocentrum cordatum]|uniref:Apple domain-containing protein n=1 Tax=Prorocentrum cordatum TaxID=2364126 RepID=A0ABN9V035_9DINO|nr:unnamed protein product [Polarella glacialis]
MFSGACREERPVLDWPMSTKPEDGGGLAATAVEQKHRPGRQICTSVLGKDIADATDLSFAVNSTASACQSRCASTPECKGYGFDPNRNSTCWLKRGPCQGDFVEGPETSDMVAGKCSEGRPLLDWPLRATSTEQGLLEKFRVTQGTRKDSVALLSHHGTYVTAQRDGSVTVDGDSVGDWESFEEVWTDDTHVSFRTFHGGFITAAMDGTVSVGEPSASPEQTRLHEEHEGFFEHLLEEIVDVVANSEEASFEVVVDPENDTVSLKTSWGNFLTSVRVGTADGVVIRGDRDTIGSWATFLLRAKNQETSWLDNEVTLQSYPDLGTYVGVNAGGKVVVSAQGANLTACEAFRLVDGGGGTVALKTCMGTFLSAMKDGSVTADQDQAGDWEHFTIETVHSQFFSALDLPVLRTGNLTGGDTTLSTLDPGNASSGEPQSVVLKTFHGGYLFPVEEPKHAREDSRPSEGWRVTEAMIFTRTCEEAGMMPITDQSTCEAAASSIGPANNSSGVDIPTVTDAGVPEGCYTANRTHFKMGTNSDNQGTGVVYRENGTVLNPICSGGCPKCAPPNPAPPAMVILFYERDLCKMKLLAASLTKHDPNLLIGTVHLVWLSKHPPSDYMGDIDSIRNAAAASHTVRFHDMSWMFGAGMEGWHTQQIVKLKASGLVEEDYYVVMDAKNALIRDIEPDTFMTPCYQAKVFADTDFDLLNSDAKGWYYKSAGVLGVDIPPGRKWSASITPVVMHTQTVINLLQDLHESPSPLSLCNGALCGHIKYGATEFTLYYLYAATKTDEKCIHREFQHNPALSMWRGFHDPEVVQKAMDDPNILIFGAQSGSMPGGDAGQKIASQLQKLFEDAGVHDPAQYSAEAMAGCVVG